MVGHVDEICLLRCSLTRVERSQIPVYAEHVRWVWRHIAAAPIPELLIVGAVDSGKSWFFRELAVHQPHLHKRVIYRYWDLLRSPGARNSDGFWQQLAGILGVAAPTLSGRLGDLPKLLEEKYPETRIVLILDHWDDAQENFHTHVDLDSLEMLQQWVRNTQHDYLDRVTARLGLVMVTRFPTTDMFIGYVHDHRRDKPGLLRVSGDVDRLITNVCPFPFLDIEHSCALVRTLTSTNVEEIVQTCGGWPGLLVAVTRCIAATGIDADPAQLDLADCVGPLLRKTLLPVVAARHGNDERSAWVRILRGIQRGADPVRKYALPVLEPTADLAAPLPLLRLPPAIRDYRRPEPLLLLDVDSLERTLTAYGMVPADIAAAVFQVANSIRDAFAISGRHCRRWRSSDAYFQIEDPRTPLVIVSDRPAAIVAEPEVLVDVTVVPPDQRAEPRPAHWRIVNHDIKGATHR